jgi:cellulose synthase/poly-beta-1,6-N-acetylglucosamine synthase-like glycosyltransferase
MNTIEWFFWISIFIVFYTYLGYGILLYLLVLLKRFFNQRKSNELTEYEPEVTLLIAAYNEKDFVHQKVLNTNQLDYPANKLHQIWITCGSDDGTPELLSEYKTITVLHNPERRGKIAAINRGIKHVRTPIVVFSDANTMLGAKSIRIISELFQNPKTGCVSGEKRIFTDLKSDASQSGEGIYWKYESTLKKWDAELYSVVGAAGELFAIRTELFQEVEPDTILDDFVISLRIAMKGYTIQYNSDAYAIETASANVKEELKRKIRIAAGGIQSIVRLWPLLNFFKYGILSFQYISHRVLRWTVAPLLLTVIIVLNLLLTAKSDFYKFTLLMQILFYCSALLGWFLQSIKIQFKALFVPYYFFIMNYAVYRGFLRYIMGSQGVNWERAKRG